MGWLVALAGGWCGTGNDAPSCGVWIPADVPSIKSTCLLVLPPDCRTTMDDRVDAVQCSDCAKLVLAKMQTKEEKCPHSELWIVLLYDGLFR